MTIKLPDRLVNILYMWWTVLGSEWSSGISRSERPSRRTRDSCELKAFITCHTVVHVCCLLQKTDRVTF